MLDPPDYLCNRPDGFAEWWDDRFGEPTMPDEIDNFEFALLAWESAMDHTHGRWQAAVGSSLEYVEELAAAFDLDRQIAAHSKARGLVPPDAADEPHVVTG